MKAREGAGVVDHYRPYPAVFPAKNLPSIC